jgi:large subunit ribosomal protein L25
MDTILEAVSRDTFGKNEARRTRRQGMVPAVLYGASSDGQQKTDATPIAVNPKALLKILHSESGANTLISLKLGGAGARVLVKDYLLDPVTRQVLHADFYRVAMDRVLHVTIPVTVKGEPKGVKQQGGVLDIVHRQVELECLPADIPNTIVVDVTELMVGQSVRVKDVATNPKWKALSDPEMMILHVIIPKVEETPAPADAAAVGATATPAEPEVIKKGKKDEETAEAAPAPAAGKKDKK